MAAIQELVYVSMPSEVQPPVVISETQPFVPNTRDIYVNDPSFWQAINMGFYSGVVFTKEQMGLYKEERLKPLVGGQIESDQVLMAKILEATGGPADFFKEKYPNIFQKR